MDAVFGTDYAHRTFRVSDPLSWGEAQNVWGQYDEDRRDGLLPQWKHFEVRTVEVGPDRPLVGPEIRSHGKYDRAPFAFVKRVRHPRGFTYVEDAARAAWVRFAPEKDQGRGGWFYWPNGRTAAQGLVHLAQLCRQKHMIVEGGNGRWYDLAQDKD